MVLGYGIRLGGSLHFWAAVAEVVISIQRASVLGQVRPARVNPEHQQLVGVEGGVGERIFA